MKKIVKIFLKILKGFLIADIAIAAVLMCARFVGQKVCNKTPKNGINETAYIDINGTKQWINIYGQDKDAPVLLYLHGGPCAATSAYDWTCLRKLSKYYVVVNWDQRGCGHNYPKYKETSALTSEIMMKDGEKMTDYLCQRFDKEKITIMGMSWGSILGSNLVLKNPEKYEAMIALSLGVDMIESQELFKEYMLEKTANDPEFKKMAESIDTSYWSIHNRSITMPLMMKYGYVDNYFKDSDINYIATVLFDPYCNLAESSRMIFGGKKYTEYLNHTLRPEPAELVGPLQLSSKTKYEVPYYLIEGKDDHGDVTMVEEAVAYFEKIEAPDKEMIYVEGGHNAPLMKTEELEKFVHRIAVKCSDM